MILNQTICAFWQTVALGLPGRLALALLAPPCPVPAEPFPAHARGQHQTQPQTSEKDKVC
eukprot:6482062-Alexandrium_andersonii.AAC.1